MNTKAIPAKHRRSAVAVDTGAPEPATTDIVRECITWPGFNHAYALCEWPPLGNDPVQSLSWLEVLVPLADAEGVMAQIKRLDAGTETFRGEIVRDEGGADWAIVEGMGPRALVIELATYLGREGYVRRPGPGRPN